MDQYEKILDELRGNPRRWLVTGAAGFIGSNLVERLLSLGQDVVAIDNLISGHVANLHAAHAEARGQGTLRFVERDVADIEGVREAFEGVDFVLHQAALGSVPRSKIQPMDTYTNNVKGFTGAVQAAHDAGVKRFVFASSSSVYGDSEQLPRVETKLGRLGSPYAATKYSNEVFSQAFRALYDMGFIGLRYFNVYGKRQDPEGLYAAVIPRWMGRLLRGQECVVYGDGSTTRDFCHVDNVVMANLLAATIDDSASGKAYNVGCGVPTSLEDLFGRIRSGLAKTRPRVAKAKLRRADFRKGDILHSYADISRARDRLGYEPSVMLEEGLAQTIDWYVERYSEGAL